ncbi:MAG: T9SS type A sorting domain-containing protein [Candidatus Kapaibacterium sp.]
MKFVWYWLILLSCFGIATESRAQVDPCLTLWKNVYPDYPNPDSVMIDTCGGLRQMFAKRMFRIVFDYYAIFPTTVATHDTILEFSWNAIDSSFPAIRSAFHYLDTHGGTLHLLKQHAQISDTSDITRRVIGLTFDNYVPVDSIVQYLSAIPLVKVTFISKPGVITRVNTTGPPIGVQLQIYPNPSRNWIRFEMTSKKGLANVELHDICGRNMHVPIIAEKNGHVSMDIHLLPEGVFVVSTGNEVGLIQKIP